MLINFNKVLLSLDKNPLVDNGSEFTLRRACANALVSEAERSSASGEDKYKRWKLATKILDSSDPIELVAEDIALIKTKVGEAYTALVSGQIFELLESSSNLH